MAVLGRACLAGRQGADSEGNGMPDPWESCHLLDPSDASDAAEPDSDGLRPLEEFRLGTGSGTPIAMPTAWATARKRPGDTA